jgi:Photosynthesis affected mutant 68
VSDRIPFEPTGKGKKKKVEKQKNQPATPVSRADLQIPQEVNGRIVRRMALFCGIPTSLGFATFIASYVIVTNHWFELPNTAVVLLSMGCLGLGVLGLTYGALSTSWEENKLGSWFGWQEFQQNFGNIVEAWKSQQKGKDKNSGT